MESDCTPLGRLLPSRAPLRLKIVAPLAALSSVVGVLGVVVFQRLEQAELAALHSAYGETVLSSVVRAAEATRNNGRLERFLTFAAADPQIEYVAILGGEPSRVVVSSQPAWSGKSLDVLPARIRRDLERVERGVGGEDPATGTVAAAESPCVKTAAVQMAYLDPAASLFARGQVVVRLAAWEPKAAFNAATLQRSGILLGSVALLGGLACLVLEVLVVRRLRFLAEAVDRTRRGESAVWPACRVDDELEDVLATVREALVALKDRSAAQQTLQAALEQSLHEANLSKERLSLAVSSARTGFWDWDVAAGTMVVNEGFQRLIDGPAEEQTVSVAWFFAQLHPDDLPATREALRTAHASEAGAYDMQYRMRAADGSYRWIRSLGKVAARDPAGAPLRMIGQHIDIAEAKRQEEMLRESQDRAVAAARSKGEFLANMSHEIRTPMTAILGYADMLLEEGDLSLAPPERVDLIQTIRRNGNHLLTLINDILDLSKLEAEKVRLDRTPFDPARLVDEVVSLLLQRAEEKGIDLQAAWIAPPPAFLVADPTRLRQILVNLVGNAVKFTQQGKVVVWGKFEASEAGPGVLELRIEDTGIGLTERQAAQLFEAFSQADASTTRRFGGTGLGLAISRRLARMMGGDIALRSRPGAGSVFTVRIEALACSAPADLGPDGTASPSGGAGVGETGEDSGRLLDGVRVLLAEDGPDNQRLLSALLRKLGGTPVLAVDGKQAIDLAETAVEPFDLVLMDMQMPVIDGYAAATRLREFAPRLPIIAITAHAMAGDRERCLAAGCSDYLTKPIQRSELARVIRRNLAVAPPRAAGAAPSGSA